MSVSYSPSKKDSALFRWLWKNYLRHQVALLSLAILFMVVEGSMTGAISYMIKPMFDSAFVAANKTALWGVGIAFLVILITRGVSGALQRVLMTIIAEKTIAAIQRDLFAHLLHLDNQFHYETSPGALLSRVQNDVIGVARIWNALILGGGRDIVALVSLLGVAIWIDPVWVLVTMIGAPLLIAPVLISQHFVRRYSRRVQEMYARLSVRLDEAFHGITTIKLNQLENSQIARFIVLLKERIRATVKSVFVTAALPCIFDVIAGLGFFIFILYGGSEIIEGKKTVGDFMSFFTAMGLAFQPLRNIGTLFGQWQTAAAGIERIKELFDKKPKLLSASKPKALPGPKAELSFDKVSFSAGEKAILSDISFCLSPGKTIAFVGSSGAGKTTIFNLLVRLFDPNEGAVRYGGIDIREFDPAAFRACFAVVTQDVSLFDESLRDNLLLEAKDVSSAQFESVLSAAHIDEFLEKLPDGLDTRLGPQGVKLSGGQRQRVAIARALLRDAPILLLDEATSALDAHTEKLVHNALSRLRKNRTVALIAHRLSTVVDADQIIVMQHGKIVASGTHSELMADNKTYQLLYRLQNEEFEA